MYTLDLTSDTYRDKVMGCWMGKNCGGTLGTPVEEAWGKEELFDIWWYPKLAEGGLPNDDLEMQLIWLEALRAHGPGLSAAEMAQAWLDHIGYNWDEYGLSKTNLRLGLQPPVSGAWNNGFVDCMGCPIRSEVWACLAPGQPRVAARYAYNDAICDHAGGESVFGELFNVAIQSSAFVVSDADLLLDIGLSYVPEGTKTRAAVEAARQAHRDGLDWKQARARVLEATPSAIAQFSPVNMGFQVIGLLYGTDFGDAMCKTVNCGYDTDSSGGTIGSWLGIRAGLSQLPQRWIEPFGLGLSTNESWGGVRHLTDGTRPTIPRDITELTDEVLALAPGVLRHHGVVLDGSTVAIEEAELYADASVRELWSRSAWTTHHAGDNLDIVVDYQGSAAARPGESKAVTVSLVNHHPDAVSVRLGVHAPQGWPAVPDLDVEIGPDASLEVPVQIPVPERARLATSNVVRVAADVERRPYGPSIPIALPGAQAWRVLQEPWNDLASLPDRAVASDAWTEVVVDANELPLEALFTGRSELVLQHFLYNDQERDVRLAVDCTVTTTAWLNGEAFLDVEGPRLIRPSYAVGVVVALQQGWNELVVRLRREDRETVEGHTLLATADQLRHGIVDVVRTRFPWD